MSAGTPITRARTALRAVNRFKEVGARRRNAELHDIAEDAANSPFQQQFDVQSALPTPLIY